MIEISDIHKKYQMGDNVIYALKGVSISIAEGDFVAIMGPSGSGKSTLMHVLGLLDVPDEGSYRLNGREVSSLTEDELAVQRREVIGFIFQQFNLLPRMTAQENVSLPLLYSEQNINRNKANELLNRVGLGNRAEHRPNELSGGQQQRVAIARSLINTPMMILADEPTGNLDSVSEKEIMQILKELNAAGITIVIVTHEEEIGRQAKRIIKMRDGVVQSDERLEPLLKFEKRSNANSGSKKTSFMAHVLQHVEQGLKALLANKVRTVLSMLGILIGVAAVVGMLALGHGAQTAIEDQLASLGSNLLVLRPGARISGGAMTEAGSVTRITAEDSEMIKEQIAHVNESAANVTGRAQVAHLNKNWSTSILGASPSYARMHASKPEVGRFFSSEENSKRARVAVVGDTIVRELLDNQNPIGEIIKINRVSFQIIGVLPKKGANSFRDQDDIIVLPLNTAMHRLLGKDYVDYVDIEVSDPKYTDAVQDNVISFMNTRHRVPATQKQEAFQVRNMADIQQALSESTRIMTLLLSVIAAISLLVGGIGIMNIMLVSVTERTREIGLRKAVGAKRSDILSQFLVESVVVSVIGGTIGIALAWIATTIMAITLGWATSITGASVALAFLFSASIGVIFGIYPARKASLLPPIDALRFE